MQNVKQQSCQNAKNDRIFSHVDTGSADLGFFVQSNLIAGVESQDHNRENVVKRNGRYDHQRSHTGITINILYKCHAKDSCTSSGRSLYKSTDHGLVLHKDPGQDPDHKEHNDGCEHTE